ncbi:hypothetical protein WJX73_000805 [Symbiochloris irregularis]|uniref:Uncharacterized protein n=1 Tax=Symbiochloris irregularis TaxID=706552 RepID=A0AAW1NVM4_9CHLO
MVRSAFATLLLASACTLAASQTSQQQMSPPQCAKTYISNGKQSYNDIANELFPNAIIPDNSGSGYQDNYFWPEIANANDCANGQV